jgi:hypothetical protein
VGEIEMGDLTAYFESDEILSLKDIPVLLGALGDIDFKILF